MRAVTCLAASFVAAMFLSACASAPPPRPHNPEGAIIGIVVDIRAPVRLFHGHPDRVFFIKLDDEHGLFQNQVIPSSYTSGGRVYLLNATPGRYAAVAAFDVKPGTPYSRALTYTTYFAKDLIEDTEVTVGPNEVVFMGSYVVDDSVGLGGADELQQHYAELIAPGIPKSGLLNILSGEYQYRGSIHDRKHDAESKNSFLKEAKVDLAAAGWDSVLH